MLKRLADAGLEVVVLQAFGSDRDDFLLSRCAILLNVHYAEDYRIFEELRCNRCLYSGILVVSETSEMDETHPLKPFIHFADLDQLPAKTLEVVGNLQVEQTRLRDAAPGFASSMQQYSKKGSHSSSPFRIGRDHFPAAAIKECLRSGAKPEFYWDEEEEEAGLDKAPVAAKAV